MRTSSTLYFPRDPFREFESLFRQAFTPAEPMDTAFSPAAEAHRAASVHHAGLKRIAAHKLTREAAIKIDKARAAEASAAAWDRRAAEALDAWARARITAFLLAWEATNDTRTED